MDESKIEITKEKLDAAEEVLVYLLGSMKTLEDGNIMKWVISLVEHEKQKYG